MGYRLTTRICVTSTNWRTQTGASGALSIHFAPLRHLRQFLIGREKVAHWRNTTSRARAAPHSGGTRPAGAYGLPTMRSPANQIDKRNEGQTTRKASRLTASRRAEFTSSLPFVIDIRNHPFCLAQPDR